ncbi:MAG: MgtC/SapB family protein [Sphingorhabdus sp.]
MNFLDTALVYPILGATLAGTVIGAEREYRASTAGLRTHILVSLSCCLLMLSAVHQIRWLTDTPEDMIQIDPVRMAHGILTGIGFLCGGVIFRDGFSVRGLTTAASLWSTSALGVLFGIGFYALAIVGTLATLFVLGAARLTDRIFPQRRFARLTVEYDRHSAPSRSAFADMLKDHDLAIANLSQKMRRTKIRYDVTISGSHEAHMEQLVARLAIEDRISGLKFELREA